MKKISIFLIIIILLTACSSNYDNKKYITAKELYDIMDSDDLYIIDVRDSEEYNSGHIKGAISIPVDMLENIFSYVEDKNSMIVVYCKSGAMSSVAYDVIKSYGYKNIYDMKGINDWEYEIVQE